MIDFTRVSEGKWPYVVRSIQVLALVGLISACDSKRNEYVAPPAPKVTVAQPVQQEVVDYLEFTGTAQAFEEANIQARVAGFLQSMHFTPGTQVKKDDLLFVIDPKEYQAELNAAIAELKAARAQHHRAEIEYERAKRVHDQGAGRETDVVKWRGERDVALAAIERAKAKVERAQLNMSYTQIASPISGRIGRNLVDVGNLVGEGEPTLLTRVTRYDPMYVYFNLNERDLLRVIEMIREDARARGLDPDNVDRGEIEVPLFLGLANEEGYPHEGRYDYADSAVDPETGTLQLRGTFENATKPPKLLPGLFARIRMPIGNRPDMPLVTERAIGTDQRGTFLMVVDAENSVERRSVQTGQRIDGLIVIEEGLQKDDRVVVKGVQRARPGRKVDPDTLDMAELTTSAMKQAAQAAEQAARNERSEATPPAQESGGEP